MEALGLPAAFASSSARPPTTQRHSQHSTKRKLHRKHQDRTVPLEVHGELPKMTVSWLSNSEPGAPGPSSTPPSPPSTSLSSALPSSALLPSTLIAGPDGNELLAAVREAQAKFGSELSRSTFVARRTSCNLAELVGKSAFINRSAVKMAELDQAFGILRGCEVNKEDDDGEALSELSFVDLAGGPGGWSQYIFWRRRAGQPEDHDVVDTDSGSSSSSSSSNTTASAKRRKTRRTRRTRGWGMTLRPSDSNSVEAGLAWDVGKILPGAPLGASSPSALPSSPSSPPCRQDSFFSVIDGADGTGNLYSEANIEHLEQTVRSEAALLLAGAVGTTTSSPNPTTATTAAAAAAVHATSRLPAPVAWRGVDLVVADGGMFDARNTAEQEALMVRLLISETLAMFRVLRAGGSFVLKMFDANTAPTAAVLVWLHREFDEMTICKPASSRPANSERYAVARGLRRHRPAAALAALARMHVAAAAAASSTSGSGCSGSSVGDVEASSGSDRAGTAGVDKGDANEQGGGHSFSPATLAHDTRFVSYLRATNRDHLQKQLAACEAILLHSDAATVGTSRKREQRAVARKLAQEWRIPEA